MRTEGIEGELRVDLASPPLWSNCLQAFAALTQEYKKTELLVIRVGASVTYEVARKALWLKSPQLVAFAGESVQVAYTSLFGQRKSKLFSVCDLRFAEHIYENLIDLVSAADAHEDALGPAPLL